MHFHLLVHHICLTGGGVVTRFRYPSVRVRWRVQSPCFCHSHMVVFQVQPIGFGLGVTCRCVLDASVTLPAALYVTRLRSNWNTSIPLGPDRTTPPARICVLHAMPDMRLLHPPAHKKWPRTYPRRWWSGGRVFLWRAPAPHPGVSMATRRSLAHQEGRGLLRQLGQCAYRLAPMDDAFEVDHERGRGRPVGQPGGQLRHVPQHQVRAYRLRPGTRQAAPLRRMLEEAAQNRAELPRDYPLCADTPSGRPSPRGCPRGCARRAGGGAAPHGRPVRVIDREALDPPLARAESV